MSQNNKNCPVCGEPVRENWKFCPACETPLNTLVCPQCKAKIRENWKRCPECEALLICRSCGRRIPWGHTDCPVCKAQPASTPISEETMIEPVTEMAFVRVPGGTFMMGDVLEEGGENEKPVHEVELEGFYLGKFPVTQAQWQKLIPELPCHFKGDRLPVEQVTWDDVHNFIKKLSAASQGNYDFRLPTEAEWEYAARSGGKDQRYAGGDAADPVAWFDENSAGTTHPVGEKSPNDWGLHDMSGNVWEWCMDTFLEGAYHRHQRWNPIYTETGPDRVIRGGSWNIDDWSVRCTRRFSFPYDFSGAGLGFRLVAVPR